MPAGEHLGADADHVLDVRDEVRQWLGEAVAAQVAELAGELGDGSRAPRAHPLLVGIREVRDGVCQPHGGIRGVGDRVEELLTQGGFEALQLLVGGIVDPRVLSPGAGRVLVHPPWVGVPLGAALELLGAAGEDL